MPMKQYESRGCMSGKANSRENYHICFKNEITHTCQISTKCAHSQILFIEFDVRSTCLHTYSFFDTHKRKMHLLWLTALKRRYDVD